MEGRLAARRISRFSSECTGVHVRQTAGGDAAGCGRASSGPTIRGHDERSIALALIAGARALIAPLGRHEIAQIDEAGTVRAQG